MSALFSMGLDLSPSACFPTMSRPALLYPAGAEVLARADVDGTHCCLAPGYGETGFAVNPFAGEGRYVLPPCTFSVL